MTTLTIFGAAGDLAGRLLFPRCIGWKPARC